MRQYSILCFVFAALASLFCIPAEMNAQTSIGYNDPEDISNILEYRLPDWSYRTWDLGFLMNGGFSDSRYSGTGRSEGSYDGSLGSEYSQTWESEPRVLTFAAKLDGIYSGYYSESNPYESSTKHLAGQYNFGVEIKQYLGSSNFSLQASGRTLRYYEEFKDSYENEGFSSSNNQYGRWSRHELSFGAGWGRLRNVVPLLRAERLSERLKAMGRPGLSAEQVQEIATVLATEHGYREVFERTDRHFWSEVLAPLLDVDNPLSPFEMFYLTDVLNEYLGDRLQGFEISLLGSYREQNEDTQYFENNRRIRSSDLRISYYHNLSLTQQLRATARSYYYWWDGGNNEEDDGYIEFEVAHLWNMADRYNLSTRIKYSGNLDIPEDYGSNQLYLDSTFQVFLEDRVSLTTSLICRYFWNSSYGDESFGWDLGYRLGLEYHLDRLVF